ncbi:MAG: hypothetical protein LHV69_09815 [Elusimicrobia bacterium]|nr:hypothetical protein [Candidatus Obscuribacterium magneticum]
MDYISIAGIQIAILLAIALLLYKLFQLNYEVKNEVKESIAPKFIQLSIGTQDLTELAVEVWRLEQRITRIAEGLAEGQRRSIHNSLQKVKRYLEKYDLEYRDYTNARYNDGLNVEILSSEQTDGPRLIKETVEPAILLKGQLVRKAKVIVEGDSNDKHS